LVNKYLEKLASHKMTPKERRLGTAAGLGAALPIAAGSGYVGGMVGSSIVRNTGRLPLGLLTAGAIAGGGSIAGIVAGAHAAQYANGSKRRAKLKKMEAAK